MLTTSIVNEREWCTELSPCSFQFSPKPRQTMPLYAYLTPKVDFKRKCNHHQSFLYEWRLTARTIRKFRIGPSLRIESAVAFERRKSCSLSAVDRVSWYEMKCSYYFTFLCDMAGSSAPTYRIAVLEVSMNWFIASSIVAFHFFYRSSLSSNCSSLQPLAISYFRSTWSKY